MLVIGLTGGIGAGKSTVAQLFAKYQVPILDADLIAREITAPNQPAYEAILKHFGPKIVNEHGLNRQQLRHLIFEHPDERIWLENLLHPLIRQAFEKRVNEITAPYCILVIPLLLENEPYPFIKRILVVDSPESLQIERASQRDQLQASHIESILKTQASRHERLEKAHDVITNDGDLTHLAKQVEHLHQFYLNLAK